MVDAETATESVYLVKAMIYATATRLLAAAAMAETKPQHEEHPMDALDWESCVHLRQMKIRLNGRQRPFVVDVSLAAGS
jgi:hypothetical protein